MSIKLSGGMKLENSGMFGNNAAPAILIKALNKHSTTVQRGNVVVWDFTNSDPDTVAAKIATAVKDQGVMGMVSHSVSEGSGTAVAANTMMWVQIWGPTDALKVNGTTDIAVGDVLGTHSADAVAAKAAGSGAGGIFARALEAYAADNSSGEIDAFICCFDQWGKTEE